MKVNWLQLFGEILDKPEDKHCIIDFFELKGQDLYLDFVIKYSFVDLPQKVTCSIKTATIRNAFESTEVVHVMSNTELQLLFEIYKKLKGTPPYYYIQRKKWREAREYSFQ